jgi:uncharacterized membrane protein
MINIPLDVDVECTDGRAGKSSSVIVNRKTLQVTHFVVKEKERPQTERLVPIEYVQESAADRIRLSCTINELQEMQEFVTINYRQVEIIRYSASNYGAVPYYTPEIETYEYQEEQVPMGGVSIRSGLEVQASDGKVGRAVNLLEDPESGQITHFVLREKHLWGEKDIVVPISFVEYVDNEAIHLKIDMQAIKAMLAVPTRGEGDLTDTALVVVTFPEARKARAFLDSLQKDAAIQFSNAAVLVKDNDGKTSIRETQDVDKRHGTVFGAITGGLVGLLGGPAGVIVGAAAGAATGRAAAKRIDLGFPDEYLQKLQEGLQPGSSALVVLLEREQASRMAEAVASYGGQFMQQELTQDILAKLPGTSEL